MLPKSIPRPSAPFRRDSDIESAVNGNPTYQGNAAGRGGFGQPNARPQATSGDGPDADTQRFGAAGNTWRDKCSSKSPKPYVAEAWRVGGTTSARVTAAPALPPRPRTPPPAQPRGPLWTGPLCVCQPNCALDLSGCMKVGSGLAMTALFCYFIYGSMIWF